MFATVNVAMMYNTSCRTTHEPRLVALLAIQLPRNAPAYIGRCNNSSAASPDNSTIHTYTHCSTTHLLLRRFGLRGLTRMGPYFSSHSAIRSSYVNDRLSAAMRCLSWKSGSGVRMR